MKIMITVMVTTKSNKSNTSNNGGCGVYAMQMSNMARLRFFAFGFGVFVTLSWPEKSHM